MHQYWLVRPTRYQFTAIMQKALNMQGLDHSRYKAYSFIRIGAVTTAASMGWSVDQIMAAGQ